MASETTALAFLAAIAIYFGVAILLTNQQASPYPEASLVGPLTRFIPKYMLNLAFAFRPVRTLQDGYTRFKGKAFKVLRCDGSITVLPISLLEELSGLPAAVASPHAALERDLLGHFTGLNYILENRMHHTIVQRKLTPRLGLLTPRLEDELKACFNESFPACDEWTKFNPYHIFAKISASLSARALVGPTFCRNPEWLDISVNYTENLFRTVVILRLFPRWTQGLLCYLVPSYWRGLSYVKAAKKLLCPKITELLEENDDASLDGRGTEEHNNVLDWLVESAKGRDRTPEAIAHVTVLLALAAVHTTLLRMVNVLYDLTAQPGLISELRAEIEMQVDSKDGWNQSSYDQLLKMDSVLRESQRMSPPTILGMKRLFKQPYTFSDGTHVPEGSYTCLATYAIENDPEHTPNPENFDGLRNYRKRIQKMWSLDETSQGGSNEFKFTSLEPTVLNFGYGKSACPGRHFASLIIKMLHVKLITKYDFKFLQGTARPKSMLAHEFLFCRPWQKMLVRRKEDGKCPF
ncbi:MAG: hypothetical protein M1820_010730 [Bogoriella megaspora]|nr:MAG: hypothetical protein M1820_010730 [Bogoriella megaspora]